MYLRAPEANDFLRPAAAAARAIAFPRGLRRSARTYGARPEGRWIFVFVSISPAVPSARNNNFKGHAVRPLSLRPTVGGSRDPIGGGLEKNDLNFKTRITRAGCTYMYVRGKTGRFDNFY